ncbi:MAG: PTS sugar transporter subunit IIA [Candidatus Omnitrophica bacterium]|nr:PTS sugar transporter subunit IIA [Candidatus Omnitrophota bacterium]
MNFEIFYMQIICFGFVLLAANFGGKITRHFHIGDVVGQVLGGIVVGPILLFFIGHKFPAYRQALESLHFFTFVFLSLVVFGIGDELSKDKLNRIGKKAVIICFVQAFATFLLVSITFLLLGFKPIVALIIGSIGIATAPAATFVIMNKLEITGKMRNVLSGLVVIDDVIEVIIFSILCQIALLLNNSTHFSFATIGNIVVPVAKDIGYAVLLGLGVFILLKILTKRRWLFPKANGRERGTILGPEFLSRLITEMPGPSVETFVIVWGLVSLAVGISLHLHLPFLITAVAAGIFVSNFHGRHVFKSLRIENATSMYTLVFFALIGANARIEAFHPENFVFIACYVMARAVGKVGGTWLGCKIVNEEKRLRQCLPKLMLPQAGVAVVEAFFVATILGADGEIILGIIFPGLIIFEVFGIFLSEQALIKWRSWTTGGGEFIDEEERIREKIQHEHLHMYNLIHPEGIHVPLNVASKGEAIWEMIRTLQSAGLVHNAGVVLETILERERQGGTTLGDGVAILHGRVPELGSPVVGLGVLPRDRSIDFGGGEGNVSIIYVVLSPSEKPELHLQVLAAIAEFLSNRDIRTRLRYAANELEVMDIIKEHSNEVNNKRTGDSHV